MNVGACWLGIPCSCSLELPDLGNQTLGQFQEQELFPNSQAMGLWQQSRKQNSHEGQTPLGFTL